MKTGQIKIGPSFFAKSKNDYSDWRFAIAREFIQNSIDAKANHIDIYIKNNDNNTTVVVSDNGKGMSEEILSEKLLAIGESSKDFSDTVGGFGVAKLILYFTHESYMIRTNNLRVRGSGAAYTIEEASFHQGTESTIVINGDEEYGLLKAFRDIIDMTQWSGVFTLNGEKVYGRLRKGSFRKELDWCKIYTNKTFVNRLIVRIGGIVMFSRYVQSDDRCVVIELTGNSGELLQSSRDSLKSEYRRELDELIRKITVDKKSAFRSDRTYYTHYEGDKLVNKNLNALPEIQKMQEELAAMANDVPNIFENMVDEGITVATDKAPVLSQVAARIASNEASDIINHIKIVNSFKHDFVIRNDAAMQIPDYYKPGSFSTYSDKLVRSWVNLIMECYHTFGHVEPFSVGFCFDDDDDIWAICEKTSEYGRVYYINPAKVKCTATNSRVFAKRWGFTPNMKYHLIVTAVHEFVHGGFGRTYHDEIFVQKSDECMAVVMKNIKRFRACFV